VLGESHTRREESIEVFKIYDYGLISKSEGSSDYTFFHTVEALKSQFRQSHCSGDMNG
jgi:hypothetical protein